MGPKVAISLKSLVTKDGLREHNIFRVKFGSRDLQCQHGRKNLLQETQTLKSLVFH